MHWYVLFSPVLCLQMDKMAMPSLSMACCVQYGIVVTVMFLVFLGMLTNIMVI
jgi:hypothetical protein